MQTGRSRLSKIEHWIFLGCLNSESGGGRPAKHSSMFERLMRLQITTESALLVMRRARRLQKAIAYRLCKVLRQFGVRTQAL
jgi:hypothetical protein